MARISHKVSLAGAIFADWVSLLGNEDWAAQHNLEPLAYLVDSETAAGWCRG